MARITLEDVFVDLPVFEGRHRSLRRTLLDISVGGQILPRVGRHSAIRALDGINLSLVDGDRVGLIGHNGSGKSTLLRVLAGIFQPTSGSATIDGRVAALLNQDTVLDPGMTGYENINHAAVLLGIRRRDLMDEIATFTQLGDFLNLPVKTYSAGMRLRISFALMTAQEVDILLLDEVLAVGDARFAVHAVKRMTAFAERACIIVLATHNPDEILRMCNKVLWLDHGRIAGFGEAQQILDAYAAHVAAVP